jgi:hypothetical protein
MNNKNKAEEAFYKANEILTTVVLFMGAIALIWGLNTVAIYSICAAIFFQLRNISYVLKNKG